MAAAPRVSQPLPLDLVSTTWTTVVDAVRAALDGTGPPVLPLPAGEPGAALAAAARGRSVRPGTALVLPTSGSTGRPRLVELSSTALLASATATHTRLGGAGRWLLALPLTHVAGWQVVVRSLLAGAPPATVAPTPDPATPFTATAFTSSASPASTVTAASGAPARYTALVPAQLGRLLDDPAATAALARLDAVLLGGAATPETLRARATRAGVRAVLTYGMTETCGGCVYDGVPLDGVRVRTQDHGRVLLTGAVLASGYLGEDEGDTFAEQDGVRWLRTSDHGRLDDDGLLHVLGRLDDQIISGGLGVTPSDVEAVVSALPGVGDVVVVGVPDAVWGQAVVAVVCRSGPALPDLATVRAAVTDRLGVAAAPQHLVEVDAVPLRGIGKPDRAAAMTLARQALPQRLPPAG